MAEKKALGRTVFAAKGAYDETTTYEALDIVQYGGSSYIVTAESITGVTPENSDDYMLIAEKGDDMYQVAVANGYEGTEEEWLADIKASLAKGLEETIEKAESTQSGLEVVIRDGGTTLTNLQNTVNSAETVKDTLESDTATAKTVISDLNTAISTANTVKSNLDASVTSATTAKSNLDTAVTSAGTTQESLETVIANANTAKSNLESAISDASTAQTSLQTVIDNASTAQTNLQAVVDSAASINATLSTTVESANTANSTLKTTITNAGTAESSLEEDITEAGKAEESLETATATANTALTSLNAANESAEENLTKLEQYGFDADDIGSIQESIIQDILDSMDGTQDAYNAAMKRYFLLMGCNVRTDMTELCDSWYELTRDEWDGNVSFYQPDVSAVSTGTKGGDNADLTCTPSTDSAANQDDYAGLPLFACVDCNWELDADTLEPIITAIDGINDGFERDNPEKFVGVLQMAGYHYWYEDDETYTHGYCSQDKSDDYTNIEPVPEAIRVDGTIRQWVLHGKYMSHTVDSKMTSYSGIIPTAFVSHNTTHTLSKATGTGYSGGTVTDDAWLFLMFIIKYGSLTADGILQGCVNNSYQYNVSAGESNVKRVLLTAAQAANFSVGMGVLIGNYSSSTDRGSLYSITGQAGAIVTAIETATVNDTEYTAIYVDTEDSFDTVANGATTSGTTYISTFHWPTGSCDSVLGNDGSPVSASSGKYPAKLQGIEYSVGGYEIYNDVILSLYQDGDGVYQYEPYVVNRAANQSTAITTNYVATGLTCEQPSSSSWQYIKERSFAKGLFFATETGGSSSTYLRDSFYMSSATSGTRVWLAFGNLNGGVGNGGLSCLHGAVTLSGATWYYLSRLSPNGNRGELSA